LPLYEYACPKCGTFERMQKFSDPILTACPTCERPVEKLLSAPAIQFKGTGWYVTDYAGKGKEKEPKGKETTDTGKSADKTGDKKASEKGGGETRKESSSTAKSSSSDKK
jgi:putative FmdB family regulatory protein